MNPKGVRRALVWIGALAGLASAPRAARAQCPAADSGSERRLAYVGSAIDDSLRTATLTGACGARGSLIRSSLSLTAAPRAAWSLLDPVVSSAWNSRIPVSQNDGAAWAGRGATTTIMLGARASYRTLRLVVAPQLVTSANAPFPILASGNPRRSDFASPFHSGAFSADLPLRFGTRRYTRIDPGESALELERPSFAVGVTSASQWWGPGIRNALVMSNNAAGIPRAYARTARPVHTPLGAFEAQWMIGGLTESPFFDADPRNDMRSLNAAVVTLRFAADTGLTIGAARSVYAAVRNPGGIPSHFADVLLDWHRPSGSGLASDASDQVYSLFARWVVPAAGLAAHVEWAKPRLPASLRDEIVAPQSGQGYTMGLEWARSIDSRTRVRVQGEVTMLEQTPLTPAADAFSFYASRAVPQGYTQEGQVIGASIGPGSSSQYLGFDAFRGRWQLGVDLGRIRWEDEAFYRAFPAGLSHYAHDVSIFAGLRGRYDSRHLSVDAGITRTKRMNFLFRTSNGYDPTITAFDVGNTTLVFRLTPRM